MFIAYQAAELDVLTGSTAINFQKAMGPDMIHLPYSCVSVNHLIGLEVENEQVYSKNCFLFY